MNKDYKTELQKLINFGIDKSEDIMGMERNERIKAFRDSMSYEKYQSFFEELESYILNDEVVLSLKEETIFLLFEFIRSFPKLEDNINLFPSTIKILFYSFNDFKNLNFLFEQVYYCDVCKVSDYNDVVNRYFEFLDNPNNELFVHYGYSRITYFNQRLIEYLDKTECTGLKNREVINNPELEDTLKSRLNDLNVARK